jgi:hypothetical protein
MSAPLYTVEEPDMWRIEMFEDGSVRYVDLVEDITEIMFGMEL